LFAHFAKLRDISILFQANIVDLNMHDGQGGFIHEREAKIQHINVSNAETESNGHTSRLEPTEWVETTRSLRMEVKSYRVDNEKIMKEHVEKNR
jgi:hypothetical protein